MVFKPVKDRSKNAKQKQGFNLVWFSAAIASSTLIGGLAQAEVVTNTNESSLINAIGHDPMVKVNLDKPSAVLNNLSDESKLIHEINQAKVTSPSAKTAQNVSSVSQLSDVKPTDWAFTALQSLVERYGCIAGYPDSTYRGKQATSRYEFAAGLNACMDKINEIISAGLSDKVSKEDLATLQKLQEEFAAELATLRGRVDALDAKVEKLEAQQFSTTTKLYGQAIFGLQGRSSNTATIQGLAVPDNGTNVTFGANVQLNLLTKLSERSALLTGITAANTSTAATGLSSFNNSFTGLGYSSVTGATGNTFVISDLSYRTIVGDSLAIIAGPLGVDPVSVFRGPNRYQSAGNGAVSAFAQRNPILNLGRTTGGIGADWQIAPKLSLQAVYSAGTPESPTGNGGLFNGNYTMGAQILFAPVAPVDVALYYLHSYTNNSGTTQFGRLFTGVGDDIVATDGTTNTYPVNTDAFGGSVDWKISKNANLGGWLGFTNSTVSGFTGSVQTFNWMSYLTFPDLFKDGNLGGIYFGQLPRITGSDLSGGVNAPNFLATGVGTVGGQATAATHLEMFYRYRVSKNISVTPGLIFLFNPGNRLNSDTTMIGVLRTTFTF